MRGSLLSLRHDAFIVPRSDVLERTLEMALWAFEAGIGLVLAALQVRVDEFDQAVQVLGGDGFVLLVKVVDVAVEDLDEKLHRHSGVHAGIGNAESTLETLKDSLAVAIKLFSC